MASKGAVLALALGLFFVSFSTVQSYGDGPLQVGFYKGKCGVADVENIVAAVVKEKFTGDITIAPALIRMQFHDCFVEGCDASILLDGPSSEKTAPPNLSVRGFDVIDAVKDAVESVCPGVVSCADIIALATREVVCLSGGGRYNVETGRRDGTESLATNVNLPGPSISVSDSIAAFNNKGLNAIDMVYLLGGHTVGVAHCFLFQDRLYNFQNTGKPDPTMDQQLVQSLRSQCPQNSTGNNFVNLDQNPRSASIVDNSYFKQILEHRGILQIDQSIALDPRTRDSVISIANGNGFGFPFGFGSFDFNIKFGQAMVKLGAVQVRTGTDGEIRNSCQAVNKPKF